MGQVNPPEIGFPGGLCTIFCSLRSAVFLQMPDIIVVLVDRSVGGEVARLGDIDCHLLRPAHSVLISCQSLVLGLAVTLEVRECHEPVFAQQLVIELLEKLPVAGFEHLFTDQEVHSRGKSLVLLIPVLCDVIRVLIVLDDLLGGLSEGENIVFPDKFRDLDVRSVHGSQRHSAGDGRWPTGG